MNKIINYRPLLVLALFLLLGTLSAYFFNLFKLASLIIPLLAICGTYYASIVKNKLNPDLKERHIVMGVLSIAFYLVGFILLFSYMGSFSSKLISDGEYTVKGTVVSVSESEDNAFTVYLNNCSSEVFTNCKVSIKLKNFNYDRGDVIKVKGNFKNANLYGDKRLPSTYFLSSGVKYYSYDITSVEYLGESKEFFTLINRTIRQRIKSGSPNYAYGLFCAFFLGNDDNVPYQTIKSYRLAGVSHVFAVSGMHVGYLALILTFIFKFFKLKRLYRAILTSVILFIYSGICGFTPSSIRAVVMSSCMLMIGAVGLKYDLLSSISASFIIVLIINVSDLFSVGFQLSYLAVIMIAILYPAIKRGLSKILSVKLAETLGVILSAQIGVLPIAMDSFKFVSFAGIIVNLILLPLIMVVYCLTFASIVIIMIVPSISKIAMFLPSALISGISGILSNIDFPLLVISNLKFGLSSVFYYGTVLTSSDIINLSKSNKIKISCLLGVIFVIAFAFINVYT